VGRYLHDNQTNRLGKPRSNIPFKPLRRMGTHTMGAARDERARASANENELSANSMMRPMGVSLLPVDMVVLPEWLLWFMCYDLLLIACSLTLV
jgi:hypothetical protein